MNEHTITMAERNLKEALKAQHEIAQTLSLYKMDFEKSKAQTLLSGEIEGKNAPEREASLRLKLSDGYEILEDLENQKRDADTVLAVARVEWDAMRYQLRLMEVLKTTHD